MADPTEPEMPPHIEVLALSTPHLCEVNGVPTRVFIGKTRGGYMCALYVVSVVPLEESERDSFTAECAAGGMRSKPRKTLTFVHENGPTLSIASDAVEPESDPFQLGFAAGAKAAESAAAGTIKQLEGDLASARIAIDALRQASRPAPPRES